MKHIMPIALAGGLALAMASSGAMAAAPSSETGSAAVRTHVQGTQLAKSFRQKTRKRGAKNSNSAHPVKGKSKQSDGG